MTQIPPPNPAADPAPHTPPESDEEVYFEGSPVVRSELFKAFGFCLIGMIILALPILAHIYHWPIFNKWVDLGCVVIALLVIVIPVLKIRSTRYRITNYRVDYEYGILGRQADTIELWHVEDISLHQTLLDRVLNTGTISVVSSDHVIPKLQMQGLHNPRPIFDSLKQRIIAVKRQRGVIKMDV
ncbi:MAG TPA: PH domain-containing protein [Tepidisphaeraceae bacterium]|jgi:membrane protein YdbS with pleckstrin-like domain